MYEYACTIKRVVDGDTVDIDIDLGFGVVLTNQRIRLYGIDAPESRTRDKEEKLYGLAAKEWLTRQVSQEGMRIKTRLDKRGKFGRILGEFIRPDDRNINEDMVDEFHAVEYYGQSKDDIKKSHLLNRKWVDIR
tara:strand:+ start:87 stop:488 length:402 start_codon:yes stop_codon:yes gene_type:complete